MEIRVLRYFLEIAREGNMSRAAERLHVTQPTLSKQMKDLEQELGKKLFNRGSTSVSLTDVPANMIAAGVPAKVIRKVKKDTEKGEI